MVRIPQISDIETAIKIYYEKIEIGNKDIIKLFGKMGSAKLCKMKRLAHDKMTRDNVPNWDVANVNTKSAYESWGLDINDLEKRYHKLKKLNLERG